LPTQVVEPLPVERDYVDTDDYQSVMVGEMCAAWDLARESIAKAQKRQKQQHDKKKGTPPSRLVTKSSCACLL